MRREWKNRSCCSARLSIFKRLKISIFRHQPRKRWGEATRRDGRSKQRRDVPGGSGAAAPGMLLGTGTARDNEPGMWPQGDEGLHKAAGLRARGMLSIKVGCPAPRGGMLSTQTRRLIFPSITALVPSWDGMLGCCTWIPLQEWDVVLTVGGRMWKSHLQKPTAAFPSFHSLVLSAQAKVVLPGQQPCPSAHPLAPPGQEHLTCTRFPRQGE